MTQHSIKVRLAAGGAVSALVLMGVASPALAVEAAARSAASTIDEVVVTATRREVNVQDIPIAVDAFDGAQLKASGVSSVADLQFLSAGLKVSGGDLARISLRGIGPDSISPTSESGVGSFLDGVFLGSGYETSLPFFDIERIEVLRGPQGTLYGRNATVGAFNYINKGPTKAFEAGAQATVGNYDLMQTEGYVSGPIHGDALTARLAFRTENHDAYTPNLQDSRGVDTADNWSVRGRLAFEPTDTFRIDLTVDYASRDNTYGLIASRADPALPTIFEFLGGVAFGTPPLPLGRVIDQSLPHRGGLRSEGYAGKVTWDLPWATLTSLTSWRETRQRRLSGDLDFSRPPILNLVNSGEVRQFTQDVYLISPASDRFEWTVGASYFDQKQDQSALLSANPVLGGGDLQLNSPLLGDKATAVFGEATYHLTETLELAAGLRYTYETRRKVERDICNSAALCAPLGLTALDAKDHWDQWTPHASLNYRPTDDITAYLSFGQGFKSGGFNALTQQTASYDPEVSTNYEIGLKTQSFGRRLTVNLAAFWMDYDDLQVQQRITDPVPRLEIRNAAKARVKGVEMQWIARPVAWFKVDGNLAYLDARYRSFPLALADYQPPTGQSLIDASGNRLTSAPAWSLNLGAQASTAVGGAGRVTLRGEYSYQGGVYFTPSNSPVFHQKAYNWFNARLSFDAGDDRWSAAAFVRNITKEKVYTFLSPGAGGTPGFSGLIYGSQMTPRTYGVTVGYKY